ncbi:MAG: hypothetical protein QF453_04700 [Candidatus Marinimicrobia bacterium]|jgi:hypothetical protein|nr:hypothetical protein [Candidatus Neomarinimicrobiota bacterium]
MDKAFTGIITIEDNTIFLKNASGEVILHSDQIWDGYIEHWKNCTVHARPLSQTDWSTGKPIYIIWPTVEKKDTPFFELYYNERLVKYWASTFGHNAINISGDIFNFSHYMIENEIMTPEEYFYRPALGEFAPSPTTGKFALNENGRNYYDKFGRNFMRTIHVLRVEGIDDKLLSKIYREELEEIKNSEPHPRNSKLYKDFSFFNRSCTTIIRDGLRKYGLKKVRGIFPRDFFVHTAWICSKIKELKTSFFTLPQLLVKEAPPSVSSPIMNPCNYFRFRKLVYKNK